MRSSLVLLIAVVLLAICFQKTEAALAAMSIDLGAQYIKIGIVKPGVPMDIVLNKESRRKTPNVIAFKGSERLFAEAAAAMESTHPKTAYSYLLSLIAKKDGDPFLQQYMETYPFAAFTFDETRRTVVFPHNSVIYNVETLVAMILWSAKKTTEAYAGQTVRDVVITVPIFLNQAERRSIAVAADIAGLNLLQLLNDGSAAALNYGVFRRKEITETPQTMLIYDMGALKTTATIVEYVLESNRKDGKDKQPVVRTIGVGYDRTLGGLEITRRMRDHLQKVVGETLKTETEITTNPRSMGKLHKEAERVKQVLSANKDTYAQVESLHEEQNFRAKVTREDLEALIVDLEPRFVAPITAALKMAEKNIAEIDQVVLMGAGTRIPKLKEILKAQVGDKELGNFLNTDEAIALGAVYQAAHLSKSFKVLPLTVYELILYPVEVRFLTKTEDGSLKPTTRTVFGQKTYYPTPNKIVTFNSYEDDFEIQLAYGEGSNASKENTKSLGSDLSVVDIRGVKDAMEKELLDDNCLFKGVKASFAIDLSGIITVAKCNVVVEKKPSTDELGTYEEQKKEYELWEKEQEELKKKDKEDKKTKKEKEEKTVEGEDKKESEAVDAGAEAEKTEKAEEPETKEKDEPVKKEKKLKPVEPKTKNIKVALNITTKVVDLIDLTPENIETAKKILADFEATEKAKHDREEAMNSLEGLIYDLAVLIEDGEEYAEFVTAEEKQKIQEEITRLRAWFEDEVSYETQREEFVERRKVLDTLTERPNFRRKERLDLPKAFEALNEAINQSTTFHAMALNLTEHEGDEPTFSATEIEVLQKLSVSTNEWWVEKQGALAVQAKNEDPVVTTADVVEKGRELNREVRYLVNKLKVAKPKKRKSADKDKKTNQTTADSEQQKTEEETTPTPEQAPEQEDATTEKPREEAEHDPSEL